MSYPSEVFFFSYVLVFGLFFFLVGWLVSFFVCLFICFGFAVLDPEPKFSP